MLDCCTKHPHESGADLCARCGHAWCEHCLVYAFGPKKPPFCLSCAMVAGGVKTGSALPALSRKELKARRKEQKAEAKAAERAAREAVVVPEPEPEAVAAYDGGSTDWANPWWEDARQPTLAD